MMIICSLVMPAISLLRMEILERNRSHSRRVILRCKQESRNLLKNELHMALFGGYTTKEMKERLGVKDSRPLADFLPTLTIAAKNLATEMTNYNVEEKDLQGESAITVEHVDNNSSVREMLGQRGIKPENLPPSEDIRKLERRVQKEDKQLAKKSGKLHE